MNGYKEGAMPCGNGASGVGANDIPDSGSGSDGGAPTGGMDSAIVGLIVGAILVAILGLALLLISWGRCVSKEQSASNVSDIVAAATSSVDKIEAKEEKTSVSSSLSSQSEAVDSGRFTIRELEQMIAQKTAEEACTTRELELEQVLAQKTTENAYEEEKEEIQGYF